MWSSPTICLIRNQVLVERAKYCDTAELTWRFMSSFKSLLVHLLYSKIKMMFALTRIIIITKRVVIVIPSASLSKTITGLGSWKVLQAFGLLEKLAQRSLMMVSGVISPLRVRLLMTTEG